VSHLHELRVSRLRERLQTSLKRSEADSSRGSVVRTCKLQNTIDFGDGGGFIWPLAGFGDIGDLQVVCVERVVDKMQDGSGVERSAGVDVEMELIAERPGVQGNVRRGETGQAGDAPFILEGLAAKLGDFELDTMKLRLAKNSHAGGLDDGVDELLDTGFVIEDAALGRPAQDIQIRGQLGVFKQK